MNILQLSQSSVITVPWMSLSFRIRTWSIYLNAGRSCCLSPSLMLNISVLNTADVVEQLKLSLSDGVTACPQQSTPAVRCTSSFLCASNFVRSHLAIDICLSVRPSVCQTLAPWQNEIIVCKYVPTPYDRAFFSSFLGPNFVVLRLGVHPERVC